MLHVLAITAVVLAAANVVALASLIGMRVQLRVDEKRRAQLEARVADSALALVDGRSIESLTRDEQRALAAVLARYARLVRGDARKNIAAYFERSPAYADAIRSVTALYAWRRASAAFALGDMAVEASIPALIDALDDKDRDVRAAATRSLGRLGAVEAVEALTQMLATAAVPQQIVATALLQMGERALPRLTALLATDDLRVRASATQLVGLLGTAADSHELIERLGDPAAEVREQAAIALGRVGVRSAGAELLAMLDDRVGFVRAAAATALGAIGDRAAVPALVAMAASDLFEPAHAAAHAVLAIDPNEAAVVSGSPQLDEVADLAAVLR
ncbi:MAG TPA: HEAT repeat domain-containing protein [Gaiellaceae bacterium]|nr:HEAT repeat domain-containing protein [Gaiellaceae bacterium]